MQNAITCAAQTSLLSHACLSMKCTIPISLYFMMTEWYIWNALPASEPASDCLKGKLALIFYEQNLHPNALTSFHEHTVKVVHAFATKQFCSLWFELFLAARRKFQILWDPSSSWKHQNDVSK